MRLRAGFETPLGSALLLSVALAGAAHGVGPDQLEQREISLLKNTMEQLDPLIEQRKKTGTAPLVTFEELYVPLTPEQVAFMEAVRRLDPVQFEGSSRAKLPPPSPREQFVLLDTQVILRDGKETHLDPQYLPLPAHEAYRRMMAAMEQELGKRLLVESGYRSPAYQLYLFLFYLPKHGYSVRETNRFVALPGFSEHGSPQRQAIDFVTPHGINGEDRPEEFEELQEYGWLLRRAPEFGFFLSYPRGGPSAYEPWHWHFESASKEGAR